MHCIYRRLTPADLDAALQMKRDFRPELISEEGAAAFLADGDRCWLFAGLLEGRVIAFAYGYALPRPDGRRMLYVHEVGVQEAYQHQGYGTALLTALKDVCRNEASTGFSSSPIRTMQLQTPCTAGAAARSPPIPAAATPHGSSFCKQHRRSKPIPASCAFFHAFSILSHTSSASHSRRRPSS